MVDIGFDSRRIFVNSAYRDDTQQVNNFTNRFAPSIQGVKSAVLVSCTFPLLVYPFNSQSRTIELTAEDMSGNPAQEYTIEMVGRTFDDGADLVAYLNTLLNEQNINAEYTYDEDKNKLSLNKKDTGIGTEGVILHDTPASEKMGFTSDNFDQDETNSLEANNNPRLDATSVVYIRSPELGQATADSGFSGGNTILCSVPITTTYGGIVHFTPGYSALTSDTPFDIDNISIELLDELGERLELDENANVMLTFNLEHHRENGTSVNPFI